MARQKKIRLLSAHFMSYGITLSASPISVLKIQSPFDRMVAAQMGLEGVYEVKAEEEATRVRGWELELDMRGAALKIRPKQATMEGRGKKTVSIAEELTFEVLRVNKATVRKHKDDEQLLITFSVTMEDENAEMHSAVYSLKKDQFDLDIDALSKTASKQAEAQLSLLTKRSKKPEPEAENETAEVEE